METLKKGINELSKEDFNTLTSVIVRQKLCCNKERLRRDRNETELKVGQIITAWDALLEKNHSNFIEAVNNVI